jgi:hydroxymethylglutaryl-CoA lyase
MTAVAQQAALQKHLPNYVRIVEVGPRDGLQNEPKVVPTSTKLELINRLSRTGLRTIEATSFVSKKHIPQLADGDQVLTALNRAGALDNSGQYIPQHISYPVLVPNERYFEAASACGAREIAIFGSASEGFSKRNINCTVAEALARFRPVAKRALEKGIRVRGYVSCVIACPIDGPTAPERVLYVCQELLAMGCYEISLGDTIGVGTPFSVRRLLSVLLKHIPATKLAGHYHDTYGQGCANVLASLEMGLRVFDASVAGLGGCPFAKGATGNLATEDLVYMLQESGYTTGVDLLALAHIGDWISRELNRTPSRAGNALIKRAKL